MWWENVLDAEIIASDFCVPQLIFNLLPFYVWEWFLFLLPFNVLILHVLESEANVIYVPFNMSQSYVYENNTFPAISLPNFTYN